MFTFAPLSARPNIGRVVVASLLLIVLFSTAAAAPLKWTEHVPFEPLPNVEVVQRIVTQNLAETTDYDPGDIISRSQVKWVLKKVKIAGWHISPKHGILNSVLRDNAYLIRQLRTVDGENLMGKLSNAPIAYHRLDRLSSCTEGRQRLREWMADAPGEETLRALTAVKGGDRLLKQVAAAPKDLDLDKPTGRIYTEAELIERLLAAHAADSKKREELAADR